MQKVILSVLFICIWSVGCPDVAAQVSLISNRAEYGRSIVEDTTRNVIRIYCASPPVDLKLMNQTFRYVYKNSVYYHDDFVRLRLDPKKIIFLEVVRDSASIAGYTMNPDVRSLFVITSR